MENTFKVYFKQEIKLFNLARYMLYLEPAGSQASDIRIYTHPARFGFFLHDQARNRMFEFQTESTRSPEDYTRIVQAYAASSPI